MLDVENWAEVRRLYRSEGLPIREIARVMGVSRDTVRAAIASDGPPKYERPPAGSVVDVVEPRIRELLAVYPRMPATVIAERIGWDRARLQHDGAGFVSWASQIWHRSRARCWGRIPIRPECGRAQHGQRGLR